MPKIVFSCRPCGLGVFVRSKYKDGLKFLSEKLFVEGVKHGFPATMGEVYESEKGFFVEWSFGDKESFEAEKKALSSNLSKVGASFLQVKVDFVED